MSFASSAEFRPRWADVWIGAVARAIDNGGDLLAAFALALVLQARGFHGIAVSGLLLAAAVPPIVLARPAGRVADTLDSRRILVIIGSIQVAICVALAYVASVYAIIGLVALLSVGATFTSPTFSALTPAMVGRDNLPKAAGISQSATALASLLAPVLGGLLIGAFHGARVPLLIDAATCLAIPAAGLLIRTRRTGGVANSEPIVAAVPEPAPTWTVFGDPLIRPLLVLLAAVVGAVTAVNVAEVFFVRGTLHASSALYGVISAVWMGGMFLGSLALSRMKPNDARSARLMFALLALISGVVAGAALLPAAVWLLPLWLFGGVLNGGMNVLAGVLIGRRAPSDGRGRAFATVGGMTSAASTAGLAAGGLLLAFAGPRPVIFWTGIAGLIAMIPFTAPLLRAARREARSINAKTSSIRAPKQQADVDRQLPVRG